MSSQRVRQRSTGSAGSTRSSHSAGSSRSESNKGQGSTGSLRSSQRTGSAGSSGKPSSAGSSRSSKPSDRLNPKTVDPFSDSGSKSTFATIYNSGGVPCRLVHGSVKHKLKWDIDPNEVSFNPLLITLAEGLQETVHPYCFVSINGFKELLATSNAHAQTVPLLPKLIQFVRIALNHSDPGVFENGIEALEHLSFVVGCELNSHLKLLIMPISKRFMEKKFKEKVLRVLQQLEQNGGKEALVVIKAKIPTYTSIS